MLLPWGIRNKLRTGELTFTDNHGGHTALVGANPNSEGTYTCSLNRMFTEGGHKLFASPTATAIAWRSAGEAIDVAVAQIRRRPLPQRPIAC